MTDKVTPIRPAKGTHEQVMDAMPGMVGAIDSAFRDHTGGSVAFMLVAFLEGTAVHATNIAPAEDAVLAMKALMAGWDDAVSPVSH